jgi:deoxyribodipyrimidine photo-lyase
MYKPSLTRAAGLQRLLEFVPNAGELYARRRNFVESSAAPGHVSELSPYLQRRLVDETEVVRAVLARHSAAAAEKFLQEVLWRTYWKGWLERHPSVWQAYCQAVVAEQPTNRHHALGLAAAEAGQTGIACFDAWAQQLVETGLLHNHVRMWFASIWIFTLRLPWSLGAAFFYRHLLDGDAASNTLSWRWVAGLQTKGKTYLARPDNIEKYTEGRFSNIRGLATEAKPVAPEHDHPAVALALPQLPVEMPAGRLGLLISPDDLSSECCNLGTASVAAIAAIGPGWQAATHGLAEAPKAAGQTAVADALKRAQDHWQAPAAEVYPVTSDEPSCSSALMAWAEANTLSSIAYAAPFVGPWNDALTPFFRAASGRGIRLIPVRRAHDHAFFPHATHGFFRLKKKIPAYVSALVGELAEQNA